MIVIPRDILFQIDEDGLPFNILALGNQGITTL
jgi:hypothetical protein